MFCFKCGKELVDGAMFCAFCGTNVRALFEGTMSSINKDENKAEIKNIDDELAEEQVESKDELDSITKECENDENEDYYVVSDDEYDKDDEDGEDGEDDEDDEDGEDDEDENDGIENEYALEPVQQNNLALYEKSTKEDLMELFFSDGKKIIIPLGGRNISFRPGMFQLTLINSCFNELALNAAEMMDNFYTEAGSIEAIINDKNEFAVNIMQAAAQNSLKFLGMIDIYDYDTVTLLRYNGRKSKFRQHNSSTVDIWNAAMGSVYEEYCAINEEADNEKLRREVRKEGRSRMQGMGFGLSGAIEAQMKAGAYNMATGAAHSIFNAVGNAMTDSARSDKLKALYESTATRRTLVYGIYNAIQQLKFDTIALCGIEYLYNREEIAKVNTILDNISKGAVPESRMDSVATDLLLKDPYNENVYRLCLERFGDHDYELSLLARFFDMEDCVRKIKNEALVNNIKNSYFIINKDAIIELVLNEHNVDWVDQIKDRYKISSDITSLEKLYDDLSLNMDNNYIMASLRLIEKNVANKEGRLTRDILAEILYTYYKFSCEIDALTDIKHTQIDTVDLGFLAGKYCLDIKQIDKDCFTDLQIKELYFGNITLDHLLEGTFRNSTIETIDELNIKSVPAYAFENCKNLIKVDFLKNTESIGEWAFKGCDKLQLVILPCTVISLAENISDNKNVFYECYDRNVESYKICTSFGWNTKISDEAEKFEQGQEFEKQGEYNKAFNCYKNSAEKKYIFAYEPLAKCYYNATGTEQNFDESLRYFIMADEAIGDPVCKHTIGYMYQNGQGAPVDIFKAIIYYLEAGKAGVAWSMNAIAMIYYQGLGGYANYIEAAKWFSKAANAGDQTAKNNLEQLLAQNPGFPPVPDNGELDYDIKYLAQHNVTAVTQYLLNEFENKDGSGFYYYGMTEKAVKKFNNAIKEYVPLRQGEIPIVCFDHTIFGSAKDGCVLTDYGVYIHNDGEERQSIPYSQITNITKDGKNIKLHTISGGFFSIEVGGDDKLVKLEEILHQCLAYFK